MMPLDRQDAIMRYYARMPRRMRVRALRTTRYATLYACACYALRYARLTLRAMI